MVQQRLAGRREIKYSVDGWSPAGQGIHEIKHGVRCATRPASLGHCCCCLLGCSRCLASVKPLAHGVAGTAAAQSRQQVAAVVYAPASAHGVTFMHAHQARQALQARFGALSGKSCCMTAQRCTAAQRSTPALRLLRHGHPLLGIAGHVGGRQRDACVEVECVCHRALRAPKHVLPKRKAGYRSAAS